GALRDHGGWGRDSIANDSGPAVGASHRAPDRPDQARACEGGLSGELDQPAARAGDRPRDRRERSLHALRRHARSEGIRGRDLSLDGSGECERDGPRLQRRPAQLRAPGERLTNELLTVDGVATGYGAEPVFRGVSFDLRRGERLAVLGPN